MTNPKTARKHQIYKILGLAFGILLLGIVLKPLAESPTVPLSQLDLGSLSLAFLLLLLHTLLVWIAWHYSLGLLGHPLALHTTSAVFFGSMLARYLPGGIWHIVGRIGVMRKLGLNTFNVSVSITMEQAAGITLSMLLGAFLLLSGELPNTQIKAGVLIPIGIGALLLFNPLFINKAMKKIASRVNSGSKPPQLSLQGIASFLALHIVALTVFGLGYVFSAAAVDAGFSLVSLQFAITYVGVTLLATFTGFITPFVPGGIGVREAILLGWLSTSLPPETASLAAVAPRLLLLVAEALLFLAFLPRLWSRNRHEQADQN